MKTALTVGCGLSLFQGAMETALYRAPKIRRSIDRFIAQMVSTKEWDIVSWPNEIAYDDSHWNQSINQINQMRTITRWTVMNRLFPNSEISTVARIPQTCFHTPIILLCNIAIVYIIISQLCTEIPLALYCDMFVIVLTEHPETSLRIWTHPHGGCIR